jgi:hypothetical protein
VKVNVVPEGGRLTRFDVRVTCPLLLVDPEPELLVAPLQCPETLALDTGLPAALTTVTVAAAYLYVPLVLSAMAMLFTCILLTGAELVVPDASADFAPSLPALSTAETA